MSAALNEAAGDVDRWARAAHARLTFAIASIPAVPGHYPGTVCAALHRPFAKVNLDALVLREMVFPHLPTGMRVDAMRCRMIERGTLKHLRVLERRCAEVKVSAWWRRAAEAHARRLARGDTAAGRADSEGTGWEFTGAWRDATHDLPAHRPAEEGFHSTPAATAEVYDALAAVAAPYVTLHTGLQDQARDVCRVIINDGCRLVYHPWRVFLLAATGRTSANLPADLLQPFGPEGRS